MKVVLKIPEERHNYAKHSHLTEFLLLGTILLGALFLVYAISGVIVSKCVQYIPQESERRLFSRLSEAFVPKENPAVTQEAQTLLDRMLRVTPEIKIPIRISVITQSEANAAAFPGGLIVITDKLLNRAKSENEISMVIAHELGHFKLRHHLRGFGRGIVLLGLFIAFGGEPEAENMLSPSTKLLDLSFSREDETAADEYALEVMNRTYGHVGGATDFFRETAKFELNLPGAKYSSTHPPSSERVKTLQQLIADRGYQMLATSKKSAAFEAQVSPSSN